MQGNFGTVLIRVCVSKILKGFISFLICKHLTFDNNILNRTELIKSSADAQVIAVVSACGCKMISNKKMF